jgi:hypothetical protein
LPVLVLGLAVVAGIGAQAAGDHRAWQHGVDLIRVGERLLVVWGSAGNPPSANPGGDWQHDVYYAWLNARDAPTGGRKVTPRILVARPEAQEPPSVAINSKGVILMTAEDGNGGINQHAGLWDVDLRVLRKYPFTIRRGGHSGHTAAMGERFLVAYGEGWVDGGGWRDLGTGENVFARIVGDAGETGPEIRLTPDDMPSPRDSWPLVAGSDRNWLVVWQRYPGRTLQSALVGADGKVARRAEIIGGLPLRYAYDVEFSSALAAYVVAGTSAQGGFVSLLSLDGGIVLEKRGLPPMASESRIVLGRDGPQVIGVYPVSPRGVAVVRIDGDAIDLVKFIDHPHSWDYSGTTGTFVQPGQVLFTTLSTTGMRLISIEVGQ